MPLAAQEFLATLKAIIEQTKQPLGLVFNVDKTGFFWGKDVFSCFYLLQRKMCIWAQNCQGTVNPFARVPAKGDFKAHLLGSYPQTLCTIKGTFKISSTNDLAIKQGGLGDD